MAKNIEPSSARGEKLEYILDMMEQLADLAGGIDERQLGGALRGAAETRRGCVPFRSLGDRKADAPAKT